MPKHSALSSTTKRTEFRGERILSQFCLIWTLAAFLLFPNSLTLFAGQAEKGNKSAPSKYKTYREAYSVGAGFYNAGKFAEAQEPFEAALQLTKNEKELIELNRALMSCYRLLPETDKMISAADYVITHSEKPAEQSLTRRSLLSFLFQRGKVDDGINFYEERLKKNADDRTALYVLTEMYSDLKRDAKRSAELRERLAAVDKKSGKGTSVSDFAKLAQDYVKEKKFQEAAELYEQIAPLDDKLAAWHWKEAATAWLKAGDKAKAVAAAKQADTSKPESRNELLTHFWHKGLADVYLDAGQAELAIPHYEQAIATTKIEGYIKTSKEKLAEAKAKAGK